MVTYDPQIIQEFANKLYAQAKSIIVRATIWGGLTGGIFGFVFSYASRASTVFALVGLAIGAFIGYSIGTARAFQYKLQAQTALCQVKIEENSRKS